jgi:hypothetical protein
VSESSYRRSPATGPERRDGPPLATLLVDGEEVAVIVRESPRARRWRLVLRSADRVELVVPRGTSRRRQLDLLSAGEEWIRRRSPELRRAGEGSLGLQRADAVWLDGQAVPLVRHAGARPVATLRDGWLEVVGADERATLERWYRREARRRIGAVLEERAAALGVDVARVSIRDTSSRWGSCSTTGALSFSWRLLLAPAAVLDYVVVHELCHRREHNHSRRFWAHVASACPSWREHARWLREHGRELQAYVPGQAPAR